jgi:hypothetical protein
MGCYSFDTIFRALKLEAPASVEASSTDRYSESYPQASIIHFHFPQRTDQPAIELTWYDGGLRPPRPVDLEQGRNLGDEGLLFFGDAGTILCGFNGRRPRLVPETKMAAFRQPAKTLPRSPGNDREWLDACKDGKNRCGANFDFSSLVTETVLLGNVALQLGEQVLWDRANLKVAESAAAQKYIRPTRRQGWSL